MSEEDGSQRGGGMREGTWDDGQQIHARAERTLGSLPQRWKLPRLPTRVGTRDGCGDGPGELKLAAHDGDDTCDTDGM